ncbi:MAG: hypothetical protein COA92_00670 [Sulfurovum sp.]|nr:MAG: hypothetical protein COA92_00670 [Sulfurovum sp.]
MSKQLTSSALLETIKIEEGEAQNLSYHQARCDYSRQTLFNATNSLDLESIIQAPQKGLFRCRIVYAEEVHSIEYLPYIEKNIQTLKIVSSTLNYNLKYANRDALDALLSANTDVDEVIIEKKGYLCDTTIANIAFFDGKQWFTPTHPLLKGTMRQKLLDEGFLETKKIKKDNLSDYSQVALINAMIGFKILKHINLEDL